MSGLARLLNQATPRRRATDRGTYYVARTRLHQLAPEMAALLIAYRDASECQVHRHRCAAVCFSPDHWCAVCKANARFDQLDDKASPEARP